MLPAFRREIGNGPIFQARQEIDGLETKTGEVKSQGVHISPGDCHSENIGVFLQHPLSSSPMTTEVAVGSEPGTITQGVPYRKRSRSFTQPHVLLDEDVPPERPRRATKETRKAREAREAQEVVEAQRARTSLRSSRAKQAYFVPPGGGVAGVDGRVADVKDVYLGEDGSIQCVVTWKSSLIAMDSLAGGELRQRCEQLFGKRYGRKELQRRTVGSMRQTQKK
ncbi:hypothetical protein LTR96_011438 [Exophiala xenobiotica]|nr:hypothetical protein LTR96_011438 [Exophiala xenobiotica]KAK5332416.1 hypothetical protein LTR98_011458 [Exophiala xenobiotica]